MDKYRLRIYLVRHGHVSYFDTANNPINPKFAQLSEQGIEQIQQLAHQLQNVSFEKIYSSTMPRSIQTAEILKRYQNEHKDIQSFDDIREIRAGRLREISLDRAELEIKKAYQFHKNNLELFVQGESWSLFITRVLTWFEGMILTANKDQNILISSHDIVNRILINWVYGHDFKDVYSQEQDYGCLNILDLTIENQRVISKRIKLQNFTPYNLIKNELFNSAMDDVYETYIATQGFKLKELSS
ncbi:histidine phosphatase family protein [Acinetobacter baumannii]|uniref:histidine phosphatase family protein n=1 Tax=Acinetobacter baumannii TaxID=470 RepID=UPI002482E0CA|nr:histidine phosphatase family protein [Acinetobacter baumannii]WGT83435.1 histidine phosphatase family protein [Acinetobacter baumannii]